MQIKTDSPEETVEIGRKLGMLAVDRSAAGLVICLKGNLGAGKTHFAKGVAIGLGIEDNVTSPTFTIINEYEGKMPFYHIDAYRLENKDEVYELGLEEYIYGEGLTLIEWPERIEEVLPKEFLAVNIIYSVSEEKSRILDFIAYGQFYLDFLKELKEIVCSGN